MSRKKFHVRKGDVVRVITGFHNGAEGKVLQVIPSKEQVIIEGVRLIKRHTRKSQQQPEGGIIEREGPIHISNVKLVERPGSDEAKEKSSKK
jgi:large subunit ribosomal protein L24